MLSLAKLAPGQEAYYEASVARGVDDYYAGRGESPGVWVGRGASELGLVGVVEEGALGKLMRGEDPASFALDSAMWGSVCLSRHTGSPDFTSAETRFVGALAEPLALALRGAPLLEADTVVADGAPGILMITADGNLESATPPAQQWLEQLTDDPRGRGPMGLPAAVHAVAMRALADGSDPHVARVRVRTAGGVWLTLYASPLAGADGARRAADVIEPARRAEVAPVVAQAYDLSPREREVLALIAQGIAVDEIARRLVISLYTARDHVKRIQAKVHVTSRAELVSKLFVDHYAPHAA